MPMSHEMVDGRIVSAEHLRIAEIIKDYNDELELAWIPPENRNHNEEYPFAVIHSPVGKASYVVFKVKEDEMDHRILARLFTGDLSKNNPQALIEADEAAKALIEFKRQEDEAAERQEMAAWALNARNGATLAPGVRLY